MHLKFILTVVLMMYLLLGEGQEYVGVQHFTPNDGLASSEVYDLLQDREGYIWASTDNGVCRYNGYAFECFSKKDGLKDPMVLYLHEDHRAWIWMGTYQNEIYIYKDGRIEEYAFNHKIQEVLSAYNSTTLGWIQVDEKGNLYAYFPYLGVLQISENGETTLLAREEKSVWNLWRQKEEYRYSFSGISFPRKKANYFLAVKEFNLRETKKKSPPFFWTLSDRPAVYFNSYAQTPNGGLFFQTPDSLYLIDTTDFQLQQVSDYPFGIISYLIESRFSDLIFVGHLSPPYGLRIFLNRKNLFSAFSDQSAAAILDNKVISHILEDQQGGLWIATDSDGIYYIQQPEIYMATIRDERLMAATGLSLASADSCFVRTKDYKIFAVGKEGNVDAFPSPPLLTFDAPSIFYDTLQNQLYGTGFLRRWENGKWHYIQPPKYLKRNNQRDVMISYNIETSHYDPNRLLLFGNTHFYTVQRSREKWEFQPAYLLEPQQRIFDILQAHDGRIWIAGMNGLYEFIEKEEEFVQQKQAALQSRIHRIEELKDGTLVVGTRHEGIVLWKGDQLRKIGAEDGLSSNYIRDIHVQEDQTIWVGTNAGLNRIQVHDFEDLSIQVLTTSNGLPSDEINKITSWKDQVWVASLKGVVKLPKVLSQRTKPIQPKLESFKINGQEHDFLAAKHLKWKENNLSIQVASLDYQQGQKIQYRYRFKNEAIWQNSFSPIINVVELPFGKYQFEVQAKGKNGEWSESTFLPISIATPLLRKGWFQLLLLVSFFIALIYWWKRQKKYFHEQQERSQQLNLLQQEIESLRQQAYRAQMNPHFIFNCLTAIQSFVLQDEKGQLIASDYLSKFAQLIRQSLEASRTDKISLQEDIQLLKNYIELEHFRFNEKFDFDLIVDPALDVYQIQIPPLLVQPFVENAIIHGFDNLDRRGKLLVSYQTNGARMKIEIRDNGKGIYSGQSYTPSQEGHRSAGLEISQKRLSIRNGDQAKSDISIKEILEGDQVVGTKVIIHIPIQIGEIK